MDRPTHRRLVAQFVILGNPKPKQRPRHGKGHTYTPRETKDEEARIQWLYRTFAPRGHAPIPADLDVELELDFYFANRRFGDLDNCAKLVQDALNGFAYIDDKQIARLELGRAIDKAKPRTEVRFYYREKEAP